MWLFLLSPMVNKALEHSSFQHKVIYTLALFMIGNFAGTIGNDASLSEGKNIITFVFYYMIGHLLSQTKELWRKYDKNKLLLVYLLCNVIIVSIESIWGNNRIVNGVFEFGFVRYNSPVLWMNAVLTFMLITSFSFQSRFINKMAKSCLSIYLLHCSFISWLIVKPIMFYMMSLSDSTLLTFVLTCAVALIIVFVCIAIHFMLSPCWSLFDVLGVKLQNKTALLQPFFDKRIDKREELLGLKKKL